MKKLLLSVAVLYFSVTIANAVPGYGYLGAPNESTRNFTPLMQHQFEKEETLDFANDAENYHQKRERKERFLDYQEGKVDVPPRMNTQINLQGTRPGSSNMQFVKDENGKIRIKSY